LKEGGLQDLGNFREGFCFRILSKTTMIWNICADSIEDKLDWMKKIEKLMEHQTRQKKIDVPDEYEIRLPITVNKE